MDKKYTEKKRYVIRLEDNIDEYINKMAIERGMKPINVIKWIIADRKQQDEKEVKGRLKCT